MLYLGFATDYEYYITYYQNCYCNVNYVVPLKNKKSFINNFLVIIPEMILMKSVNIWNIYHIKDFMNYFGLSRTEDRINNNIKKIKNCTSIYIRIRIKANS